MNTVPRIKPAAAQPAGAERIDPLEWETRVDLAACYRLVDLFGMCDLHLNHISARVPGREEHFLINPFGMMYEEITASSLIKIDLKGNIIANSNPDYSINLPATSSTAPSTAHVPTWHVFCTLTPMPAWRCPRSNADCCRSRRPQCAGRALRIMILRAWSWI
jgi:hypothetical protein